MLQVGGKGLTDAVVAEVASALEHHELIKVKVAATDREARDALIEELAARADAVLVQRIGHVAILYRPNEEQRRLVLPRSRRSEEHTSVLQSLMRNSYALFCLKQKTTATPHNDNDHPNHIHRDKP